MKHIITLALFAAPFVVSAQEQPTSKKANTPPTTEKSISQKGVTSTKSRSVSSKKTGETKNQPATETQRDPAPATTTATSNEKPKN
jgi:hypothetical protein